MAKKIPQINASSMADISFLLLIFFLVTTSMDVNQGLARRLPAPVPPDQKVENTDINKRLRAKAKEFIKNENDDATLPKLVEEDFGEPIGVVKYTKDHVISVQNDVDTQYQAYLDVQNELVAAYNELRDECARQYFHKAYAELDEDQQKQVQKVYPQKISEAEPKNYGGE